MTGESFKCLEDRTTRILKHCTEIWLYRPWKATENSVRKTSNKAVR